MAASSNDKPAPSPPPEAWEPLLRAELAYVAPAVVAWAGIHVAGIHPTIAGVIIGLVTPVCAWLGPDGFLVGVKKELEHLARASPNAIPSHELAESLRQVDDARREATSPAESLIETLHPWVAFGIMPVFALANAGVSLAGGSLGTESWRAGGAVAAGLVAGRLLLAPLAATGPAQTADEAESVTGA